MRSASLVTSFNQMTADLRTTNAELEQRRRYTETLLRNVSAGVVALDRAGRITTINPCAERLLGQGCRRGAGPALCRGLSAATGCRTWRGCSTAACRPKAAPVR